MEAKQLLRLVKSNPAKARRSTKIDPLTEDIVFQEVLPRVLPTVTREDVRRSREIRRDVLDAEISGDVEGYLAEYEGQPLDPEELKRRQLLLQAKAIVKSRVLKAREDPNAFVEYAFRDSETGRPMRQAQIHRDLQDLMASGEDCISLFPRDHGKTTQLEAHAIWRLGNDPSLRIKIVSASDGKAVERLFTIIQHLQQNDRVKDVFPWLKPAKIGEWTKHKVVVDRPHISRDASIEAVGILSTVTGGRADLLFADDVVDRRNALELPKLRETVKSAWDSDWSNLLEPNAQIIYHATPWHVADLTHKLIGNPTYKVIRHAVGNDSDPFAPIWPEKWPREALEKRCQRIGWLEYDRGFRLRALSGEYATVNKDWIAYWEHDPDLDGLHVISAFDVSSGTATDWFANVTIGVDVDKRKIYVLEAWHAKLTFLARANAIAQQNLRWRPNVLGLEEETMKSLSQYLDATTLMQITTLRPHLPKRIRLMAVTPWLERGDVIFNPSLEPSKLFQPDEQGDLVGELADFPLAANDDLVDAFVHAVNLASLVGLDSSGEVGLEVDVIGGEDPGSDTGSGGLFVVD